MNISLFLHRKLKKLKGNVLQNYSNSLLFLLVYDFWILPIYVFTTNFMTAMLKGCVRYTSTHNKTTNTEPIRKKNKCCVLRARSKVPDIRAWSIDGQLMGLAVFTGRLGVIQSPGPGSNKPHITSARVLRWQTAALPTCAERSILRSLHTNLDLLIELYL